jgi:hypothetical protein
MKLAGMLIVKEKERGLVAAYIADLQKYLDIIPYIAFTDTDKKKKLNISDLGAHRQQLLSQIKEPWVLMLDIDERISEELAQEIKQALVKVNPQISGFRIPYQNHFLGRPLIQPAEQYAKVRLFRQDQAHFPSALVHEDVVVTGKIIQLSGKILHYSYRTPFQVFGKFTDYARREASQKFTAGERVTIKKMILYGPHMFYARFYRSGGHQDGWHGLILSLLFAYMEQLTYILLAWYKLRRM